MEAFSFLKRYWNIITAFALAFVTLFSEVLIAPSVDKSTSIASVNLLTLSRILIVIITLVMLYPMSQLKARKHAMRWWVAAAVLLLLAVFLFFRYHRVYFVNTATDRLKERTVVIGNELLPSARPVYDSLMKINGSQKAVNGIMLEAYADEPTDIWLPEGIQTNTIVILQYYLGAMILFYFVVLCAAQAIYCGSSSAERRRVAQNVTQ